jgi:hypothetical protein
MKKIFTFFCFLIFALVVEAQVDRNYVLVEIATGTWCTYCPGAAMGADDLHDNGDPAAIIENHNGDAFANVYSNTRNDYYGISGYPTAFFDGSYNEVVGGSHTVSMYSSYKPIVDARILDPSQFTMEIYGEQDGDDYNITVRIQQREEYSGDNLWLRLALTESDITYSWQGQTHLNFVNRIMVPNAQGTDLSNYDLSEINDIELTFTFDNSWVDTECELVAFIQDDASKEVLQSNKVGLTSLVAAPQMLSADFTSSAPGICTSGSVDYSPDYSDPSATYSWSFPGGTPSTSTDENPSVYYDVLGEYDVQLTIDDGLFIASNLETDFMAVVLPVAVPNTPDGEAELCTGNIYYYSTPDDIYSAEYEWELSPSSAGSLSWDMNEATLETADNWTGDFTLKVRRSNVCGVSEWSDELDLSLYQSPNDFNLTGGGGFCQGSDGIEIGLDGSESGIDYELYFDGIATGNIVAGTGSAISFGYQTNEGYYSIFANTDYCLAPMTGQEEVWEMYAPLQPGIPTGDVAVCNNEESIYETEGATEALAYIWVLEPDEAGIISDEQGLTASVVWNEDYHGEALLSVFGYNVCGAGEPAEIEISIQSMPSPEIEGQQDVCDYQFEQYGVPFAEGSTYLWEISGGTVTDGQGTNMITVEWGEPGDGSLSVTEETSNGCVGSSEEFDVLIDECTGIDENLANAIQVHPNPAKDFVNIQTGVELLSVSVYTLTGELVVNEISSGFSYKLNTSGLVAGLYLLKINTQNGMVSKRLIIE